MLFETLMLAQRELRRNVLRSSLTVLGIVIGVAAVITMVTLGGGATAKVTNDISKLGSNLLQVRPGSGFHGPGGRRTAATPFEADDALAIERQISGLRAVAPASTKSVQAIYGNQNSPTQVTGTTNGFFKAREWGLATGRSFSGGELRSGKAVCILGATVKSDLFADQDPLGAMVRIGKIAFKVVGVLQAKGMSGFGRDQDDLLVIPLRTFQRRLAGNTEVAVIYVAAQDGVSTTKVQSDIERLMRERRRIPLGKEDNFNVRDMKEIINTLAGTTQVLTTLLSAVAAVSLLVGGIGIMNIMLVSVTERTREIGTRLAIGAREREVLLQFLIEAVVLASFGGAIGILLGLAAAATGASLLSIPFVFNPGIVTLAFLFSAAVGVIFGYFPARKAARLDPIEALRHE
jgi:putative ABC transport system permease protein